jgi:hypothetical protein
MDFLMAKAKLHRMQTPRTFNVKLTEGEVDFILGVCARIGGSQNSPRKYAKRLAKALSKAAGYDYKSTDSSRLAGFKGSGEYITFRDYDGSPSVADEVGLTAAVMRKVSEMHEQDSAPAPMQEWREAMDQWRNSTGIEDPHSDQQLELPF